MKSVCILAQKYWIRQYEGFFVFASVFCKNPIRFPTNLVEASRSIVITPESI